MRRLLALGALALVGCQPALASEYVCARRECPPGWTCWADGRCREAAPDFEVAEPCDVDERCTTRMCSEPVDPRAAEEGGYCTIACTTDVDCEAFTEGAGHCVLGACRASCNGLPDCPDGTECWFGIAEPGVVPGGAYCFHLARPDLDGSRSCTGNGMSGQTCQLPGWCVQLGDRSATDFGVCSMICEARPDVLQCPRGSECAPLVRDFGQCLVPCPDGETDCPDEDLSCVAHANGNSYCMPDAWAALTLPLDDTLERLLPPMMMGP